MSGGPAIAKEKKGSMKGNTGTIDTAPCKGTRDFPPDDMRMRTWLFDNFRKVSRLFAFEEVDFPMVESEELYTRKAGEEIVEQLYNFEDKGGRKVALRPELTPSLARLVLQKGKSQAFPLKWFAIGQCWRYENTTRGRRREHYQWNMDIIGVPGVEAEAELLSAIVMFFTNLGITSNDVGIKVSNRKVLQAVLEIYNIQPDSFAAVCVIVDKLDKLPRSEIESELDRVGVPSEAIEGILKALTLQSFDDLEALIGEKSGAVTELKQLFALAESYGIQDWLRFDASVVRGLAYYTGTVFEGFDKEKKLRAICGGGRYDRLLSTYGGPEMAACGFGFGDAVIVELLMEKGILPTFPHSVDDIVFAEDESLQVHAAGVAARLRNANRVVELVIEKGKKLRWAFKQCDMLKPKRLIVLGTKEWEQGKVRVRDVSKRETTDQTVDELTQALSGIKV
jgi:histidyl-tRNA synthetase